GSHDHARGTESALKAMALAKCFLNGVQLLPVGKAFNGRNFRSGCTCRKNCTGLHGEPINNHGTCATMCRVTADMRSSQSEMIPDKMNKKSSVLDFAGFLNPVDRKRHSRHIQTFAARASLEIRSASL